MNNSYRFFENKECKYYPCHKYEEINCLFCYCPLYNTKECVSNQNCYDCLFPHLRSNYQKVVNKLIKEYNFGD